MAEDDAAGPSLMIGCDGEPDIPLYLVSFDKHGRCTAPRTRTALLADAASRRYTDLHIYSHGWNNVFDEAVHHYTEFFTEYAGLRRAAGLDGSTYRPLLAGLIWPSTALLAPGEEPPKLASIGGPGSAGASTGMALETAALAAEMTIDDAMRLSALATQPGPLNGNDSMALARLLAPILQAHAAGVDEGALPPAEAESVLWHWGASKDTGGQLGASGLLSFLDPRDIIRKATVYLMKDRAGVVGASGEAELLREALEDSPIRVHLTGHSYGAKVMLSALAKLPPPLQVTSVLLLQPAISARCFAERIAEHEGQPGGYRHVLDRVQLPLFTTFSRHDQALNSFYPLALRRERDIAEFEPMGQANPYAALGAIGPQDLAQGELEVTPILDQKTVYPPAPSGVRVRALDGATGISGHGDVRNGFTEWALANLVRQAVRAAQQ